MPYYPQDPWEERTQDDELYRTRTTQPQQQYGVGQRFAPMARTMLLNSLLKWFGGSGTAVGTGGGFHEFGAGETVGSGMGTGSAGAGAGAGAGGSGLLSFLAFLSPLLLAPVFKGGEGHNRSNFVQLIGDWLDTKGGPFG